MIEINNLTTNKVDKEFLKEVVKKVLGGENRKEMDLSIVLVGQGRIRELNKKYRKKNKVTDVLSFLYDSHKTGEIVICLPVLKKNAKKYKSTFKKELARILIHGILHILDYSHQTMEKKENHYLSQVK